MQQYAGDHQGFLRELRGIWDILYPCGSWHDSFLTQAFQIQPTLNIPKASLLSMNLSHDLLGYEELSSLTLGVVPLELAHNFPG